jgi:cytochrome c2
MLKVKQLLIATFALSALVSLTGCPSENTEGGDSASTQSAAPAATENATSAETTHASLKGDPANGPTVFKSKGCVACHKVASIPEAQGAVGPALDGVATVAATRVSGEDAETYLRNSIEKPEAFLVPGYQNLMMQGLRAQMSDQEYADLITWMLTLKS